MHSLYTRFVLWLIRPAVERIADERIAAAMRTGGVIWKSRAVPPPSPILKELLAKVSTAALDAPTRCQATTGAQVYEAGIQAARNAVKVDFIASDGGRWNLDGSGRFDLNPGDESPEGASSCRS